ncbi:MAG: TIGR00266 family protein [Lachnospiraceae bacterium]|nr:TIGR00266 family protein [Lachnospiraceae bacterium]
MQYEIKGAPFPVAVLNVAAGEAIKCQAGAMCWMSPNMQMETSGGGIGKMFGKALTGEALYENKYTAQGGPGMIAVGSGVPGNILAIDLTGGKTIIAQKKSFLASEMGVNCEIQKNFNGAGLFGGGGFIMQKFTGQGMVFIEVDGSIVEYELQPGQPMKIDTGCLAAMEGTVQMNVERVQGFKNVVAGGEGLFNTTLVGPGRVWLQTMSIPSLAGALAPYMPAK